MEETCDAAEVVFVAFEQSQRCLKEPERAGENNLAEESLFSQAIKEWSDRAIEISKFVVALTAALAYLQVMLLHWPTCSHRHNSVSVSAVSDK